MVEDKKGDVEISSVVRDLEEMFDEIFGNELGSGTMEVLEDVSEEDLKKIFNDRVKVA